MLNEVMDYFNLAKDIRRVGYYETDSHRKLKESIKSAIAQGQMVALTGVVGTGKTTLMHHIQRELMQENLAIISRSFAVEKERVSLNTLVKALFYDLATDKDFKIPAQSEHRERMLQKIILHAEKPVVLIIEDAHDLKEKTLIGFKRLLEVIQDGGAKLSVILIGHTKLRNDLKRAAIEEIGSRVVTLSLDGITGERREYIHWLLEQSLEAKQTVKSVITDEAIDLLAELLVTPLQIEHYLEQAFIKAFSIGKRPIDGKIITSILANDIDEIESKLARHGYNCKALADVLNLRPAEVRAFLHGQLPPGRTQQMKNQMLAVGIPV